MINTDFPITPINIKELRHVTDLDEWVKTAREGETVLYASSREDSGAVVSAARKKASDLVNLGKITTMQKRYDHGSGVVFINYIAVRLSEKAEKEALKTMMHDSFLEKARK